MSKSKTPVVSELVATLSRPYRQDQLAFTINKIKTKAKALVVPDFSNEANISNQAKELRQIAFDLNGLAIDLGHQSAEFIAVEPDPSAYIAICNGIMWNAPIYICVNKEAYEAELIVCHSKYIVGCHPVESPEFQAKVIELLIKNNKLPPGEFQLKRAEWGVQSDNEAIFEGLYLKSDTEFEENFLPAFCSDNGTVFIPVE